MDNIDKIIEHLQEMGKVDVTNCANIGIIQEELENRNIYTRRDSTDREYLILLLEN